MVRADRGVVGSLILLTLGCRESTDPVMGAPELVVATESLVIGSINEGPEAFGRITGLTQDSLGRIYVADLQAAEVRVFAPDGQHLFSLGRRGSGPGELASPCCLAWSPDGALWIRDGGNQRYSGFEVGEISAAFISSLPMAHTDGNYLAPVTFTTNGHLVDVGHRVAATGAQVLVRFMIDAAGIATEAETITRASVEALGGFTVTSTSLPGARFFFYQPFSTRELLTHGPQERWAHALSSVYDVTLREGDSVVHLRGTAEEPMLSSEERESAVQRMQSDAERAGMSMGQLPYGVPDSKPPLQAIFFDEGGRLWVELSRPDGQPRVADVWEADGTLRQRVQWPEDIALAYPSWVGDHSTLGIRRDSLGVEHVVRLSF